MTVKKVSCHTESKNISAVEMRLACSIRKYLRLCRRGTETKRWLVFLVELVGSVLVPDDVNCDGSTGIIYRRDI